MYSSAMIFFKSIPFKSDTTTVGATIVFGRPPAVEVQCIIGKLI